MANGYLDKLEAAMRAGFEAGLKSGRQQIIDMMSLTLNDPEIMGKDVFGKDRLVKVVKGIDDYIDKYQPAWEKSAETDYYQEKLDSAIAGIYGENIDRFYDRYKYAPKYDYMKGKWKK